MASEKEKNAFGEVNSHLCENHSSHKLEFAYRSPYSKWIFVESTALGITKKDNCLANDVKSKVLDISSLQNRLHVNQIYLEMMRKCGSHIWRWHLINLLFTHLRWSSHSLSPCFFPPYTLPIYVFHHLAFSIFLISQPTKEWKTLIRPDMVWYINIKYTYTQTEANARPKKKNTIKKGLDSNVLMPLNK